MTDTMNIPTEAPYPGSGDSAWDRIPLGVGVSGEVAWELSQTPNLLITGAAGSGKSVAESTIFQHLLQHKAYWKFVGIDMKGDDFKPYAKHKDVVLSITTNLDDAVSLLLAVELEIHKRTMTMQKAGVQRFTELPTPPKAMLVMIDELVGLLAPAEGDSSATVMKQTAGSILRVITRLGQNAGVYLVGSTQRPDDTVLDDKLNAGFTARIACGQMSETASQLALDSDAAMHLPADVRGRAIIQVHGQDEEFQMYYAPPTWADEHLSYLSET